MSNRVRNLESYYITIDQQLRTVGAHMEDDNIPFLLKMCRLKPHPENNSGKLTRWWIDEWGNSLKVRTLNHCKSLKRIIRDIDLEKLTLSCTDLYRCLPLDKMIKMSKLLYLLIGQDWQRREHAVVASLGIDNFLRVFTLIDGYWHNVSPLLLNVDTLRWIAYHRDDAEAVYINNSSDKVLRPCLSQQAWLCSWQAQPQIQEIIKSYPFMVDALKLKKGN